MFVLFIGVVLLLAAASLASTLLVGHALLQSRLIDTETQSSPSAAVVLNLRSQPLTA